MTQFTPSQEKVLLMFLEYLEKTGEYKDVGPVGKWRGQYQVSHRTLKNLEERSYIERQKGEKYKYALTVSGLVTANRLRDEKLRESEGIKLLIHKDLYNLLFEEARVAGKLTPEELAESILNNFYKERVGRLPGEEHE